MTSPFPTYLSFLGIAKEATAGTPVSATSFIPVHSLKPVDNQKYLTDKGWRGSYTDEYGEIPGTYHTTYDFDGDVFPDTIGFPLAGLLGDVTVTGASAPYSTGFALLNSGSGQPPTYTLSDFDSLDTRQFPGFTFEDIALKFNADGLLTYSAKGIALPAINGVVKPTSSFSALPPVAGWTGVISIGGSVVNTLLDGEISLKRKLTVIDAVDNSNGPRNIFAGPLSVDGKMTIVTMDSSALTAYLTNSQPSLDVNYQAGAGAAAVGLQLHMSKCAYTAATLERGKDYLTTQVTFKAIANTLDAGTSGGLSPIKATVKNAIAAGTYK